MRKYTVSDGFPYYIEQLENADYRQLFVSQDNFALLGTINEEKAKYRYAPDKWSMKQIIGHITDHERIMTYRVLRISRKDPTPLAGYDQELLVANSRFDQLSWMELMADFKNVRTATVSLMNTFSEQQFYLKGFIWKFEMTIEDFLKSTIGHELHHINIIKEKYL
jgi:hypothetical protein